LPDDSQEIEKAFAERSKDSLRKPPKSDWLINFKDIQFDEGVRFEKFLFTACSFEGAVFSSARFDKATFSRSINFKKATFHGEADFNGASFRETFPLGAQTDFSGTRFLSAVSFDEAAFAREVYFNGTIFSDETRFRAASFSGKTYSQTRLSPDRPTSMVRLSLGSNLLATQGLIRMCISMALLSQAKRTLLTPYLPHRVLLSTRR
jgi:uncharacterized protein YjbI with pentapeptide repeats